MSLVTNCEKKNGSAAILHSRIGFCTGVSLRLVRALVSQLEWTKLTFRKTCYFWARLPTAAARRLHIQDERPTEYEGRRK